MEPFHAKLVAGATGSAVTALTMTPFDVVKTRLQTQPPQPQHLFPRHPLKTCCQPNPVQCVRNMSSLARSLTHEELVCVWENGVFKTERVNGFFDAVRHVWRAEGIRGLWKGAGTSLVIGVPSATSYMLTYDHLLNVVLPPLLPYPVIVPLTAGILARSSISTIVSPLELIRTNLQSTPLSPSNPHTLRSVLTSIRLSVREKGVLSLWRGLSATLWRDVPFSGIYWAGYEMLKKEFARHDLTGTWVAFTSGAISGTTAAAITSPWDVLKTRRQTLAMSAIDGAGASTGSILLRIVRTEGMSALFAGATPRMVKIAPACGIMIACYEGVGKFLAKKS
ncbi:mitochondrial carrier domain-containing protein [Mycena floridula]|nr:mitochondrial carrier domain-containing protein [Mycena floridula]